MASLSSELPNVAATVTVYDQSDGLYGALIDAPSAVASTSSEHHAAATLEGSDLTNSVPKLCSVQYGYADNRDGNQRTGIEFVNYCSSFVRIRWVDADGIARPSHIWTLAPGQDMFQSTTPGHVFVVSAVMQRGEDDLFGSNEDEAVLGAYRPKRSLSSGANHCVQIHDGDGNTCVDTPTATLEQEADPTFILEVVLADRTSYDALVVSASWIDRQVVMSMPRQDSLKVLDLLHKIVSNILEHPDDIKYRKLRLSNGTVRRHIGGHWYVMDFLGVLGFDRTTLPLVEGCVIIGANTEEGGEAVEPEEYLAALDPPTGAKLELYRKSISLLDMLKRRCSEGFVADVAPPTPWDEPIVLNGGGRRRRRNGRTGFAMTDDDRWARVERARRFRRNAGPRPRPGNAPSDRGRWGRPR